MIILKTLIIILCILPYLSWCSTCYVQLYKKVYYIESDIKEKKYSQLIKNTNCNNNDINNLLSLITKFDGHISEKYLNNFYKDKFNNKYIKLSPKKYNFFSLNQLIHQELQLSKNDFIFINQIGLPKKIIKLKENQFLKIKENSKFKYGQLILRGEILNYNHKLVKDFLITTTLKNKILAYRITKNSSIYTSNLNQILASSYIITENPEKYFQSINNISYYRLNKNLAKNSFIKLSDLTPKKIIKRGQKVNLILKRPQIRIKTFGKAQEDGYIDQNISILYAKGQKKLIGKVVNFNTVVIQ